MSDLAIRDQVDRIEAVLVKALRGSGLGRVECDNGTWYVDIYDNDGIDRHNLNLSQLARDMERALS